MPASQPHEGHQALYQLLAVLREGANSDASVDEVIGTVWPFFVTAVAAAYAEIQEDMRRRSKRLPDTH